MEGDSRKQNEGSGEGKTEKLTVHQNKEFVRLIITKEKMGLSSLQTIWLTV